MDCLAEELCRLNSPYLKRPILSFSRQRFDRIDRVSVVTRNVPIGWIEKFGLIEVFHAGVERNAPGAFLLAGGAVCVEWQTGAQGLNRESHQEALRGIGGKGVAIGLSEVASNSSFAIKSRFLR